MSRRFGASLVLPVTLVLFGSAGAARAQETPPAANPTPTTPSTPAIPEAAHSRERFLFGPEIGTYVLTDSKARDAFGQSFFNYGFGLGKIPTARNNGIFLFDASIISGQRGGSRVLLAPLGATYRVGLGRDNTSVRPYVGVGANLIITDFKSDKYNVASSVRATGGGSVLTGLTFSDRGYIQARYYAIAPTRGFNLSGANFSAGFRF